MLVKTSIDGFKTDFSTDPSNMNGTLWDFDIDGFTLKEEHRNWLDSRPCRSA
jgi:hypothetical protein